MMMMPFICSCRNKIKRTKGACVYVHVLVCNILLESQKPAWARLCALDPAPETFYALLLRLVLEFAACALVGFYAS